LVVVKTQYNHSFNLTFHNQLIKKRWIIKIGSALLTNKGRGLDKKAIKGWVEQIATLKQQYDMELVLVSSGAVAEGMTRLGWKKRPLELYKLQAAAAVGQMGMIQTYESFFQKHALHTAQILLTHDDLVNRQRYLNARSTLRSLIDLNVIPVVNENDTVTTDEFKFGDNDTLASLVANLIEADTLIILTDQKGLCEEDPRLNPDAKLITEARAGDPNLLAMASNTGGELGCGGMLTKLKAARLAARSGTRTILASGKLENVLLEIAENKPVGTLLKPVDEPIAARKQWLASHLKMQGKLYLDDGAVKVLRNSGKSLLPIGVVKVQGQFSRGEMVACFDAVGQEIARGLVNYNFVETKKILGHPSGEIKDILGYVDKPELIHRDNLVLVE